MSLSLGSDEADGDVIGSWNIRLRALKMREVPVPLRKPTGEWMWGDSPLQTHRKL